MPVTGPTVDTSLMRVNLRICWFRVPRKLFINVGKHENTSPSIFIITKERKPFPRGPYDIVFRFMYEEVPQMGTLVQERKLQS